MTKNTLLTEYCKKNYPTPVRWDLMDGNPLKWREQEAPNFDEFDFSVEIATLEDMKKDKIGKFDTPEKEVTKDRKRMLVKDELSPIDEVLNDEGWSILLFIEQ